MRCWSGILGVVVACGGSEVGGERFRKHVLDPVFRSECVTVFDVDRDGVLDVVTGEHWYQGPDFVAHELRPPRSFDPLTGFGEFYAASHRDLDGDGDEDLILVGAPGTAASWCVNPSVTGAHWTCHEILAASAMETPKLIDLFGDGAPVLVTGLHADRVVAWLEPAVTPEAAWLQHPLTAAETVPVDLYNHGLGSGDVNGDGRDDLLTITGWVEQPLERDQAPWPWHPVPRCPDGGCGGLVTDDVDGDGLADIIATSPHGYGVWWWQQHPGLIPGEPEFEVHPIDTTISQTHTARLADLDGDGVAELVTGKRWLAHLDDGDPGSRDPVLLVFYQRSGTTWRRIPIDDDSGIGTQFEVVDVGGDGAPDIVVSNKKGVFYFEQL